MEKQCRWVKTVQKINCTNSSIIQMLQLIQWIKPKAGLRLIVYISKRVHPTLLLNPKPRYRTLQIFFLIFPMQQPNWVDIRIIQDRKKQIKESPDSELNQCLIN